MVFARRLLPEAEAPEIPMIMVFFMSLYIHPSGLTVIS
jgi:hypothetical protein